MLRRDKQADLRRRMAEARSRLASSHSNSRDADKGDHATAGGKRPPVAASAGAGGGAGGGILRKSKYSSNNAATENGGGNGGVAVENGGSSLSALMGGYGSSSDEGSSEAPSETNSLPNSNRNATPSAAVLRDDNPGRISVASQKRISHKQGSHFEETTTINESKSTRQRVDEEGIKMPPPVLTKGESNIAMDKKEINGKSSETSDSVWDDFNSLLADDDKGAYTVDAAPAATSAKNAPSIPESKGGPLDTGATPTKNAVTKRLKKKRKRDPTAASKDAYDNSALAAVEQASYEARLARLMLLTSERKKSRQRKKSVRGAKIDDEVLPPLSAGELYDPKLAFQQDEEDEELNAWKDDMGMAAVEISKDVTSKSSDHARARRGVAAPSPSMEREVSTPLVDDPGGGMSLAKMLRNRRDQARQLSSRGDDDNANYDDGCWF